MNKTRKIWAVILALAAAFCLVFGMTACTETTPPPKGHTCVSKCPECGLCLNEDCKEDACKDKCKGHTPQPPQVTVEPIPIKGEHRFDFDVVAGYAKIDNARVTSKEGVGSWITDFSWANASRATLNVYSAKECQADFVIKVRKTADVVRLTSMIAVNVNNETLDSEAQVPASLDGADADFAEVNLGQFWLEEGDNLLEIVPQGTLENFDFMSVVLWTDEDADLVWTAMKDLTGGYFSAIDEHVEFNENYKRNEQEDCLGIAGYGEHYVAFTIYAGRSVPAKISMITCSMPNNDIVSDHYNFQINGVRQVSSARMPSGALWGDYTTFEIGTYMLREGKNVISFSSYHLDYSNCYNIRALVIDAGDTLLGWEPVAVQAHECYSVCAICGGCLDEDCDEDACDTKCDCEFAELDAVDQKVDVAGGVKKDIENNIVSVKDHNVFNFITFTVSAPEEVEAVLLFNISANPTASWVFVDYFRVWINDEEARNQTDAGAYVGNRLTSENYPARTVWAAKTDFSYIEIGKVTLNAGSNEIVLGYTSAGNPAAAFDVRGMALRSQSTLTYEQSQHIHFCTTECAVCGGCRDEECLDSECETKCECVTEEFSAMDNRVELSAGLERDLSNNYVKQNDYAAAVCLTFTINASAAGKAELAFNVSGNAANPDLWTFVDFFRVWVNPVGAGTAYPYDEAEKLSKDIYTAKTVYASWEMFSYVVLGAVDLKEGENVIALGYTSVGNADFRFNVRGMSLRSSLELSFVGTHECGNVCPICDGCLNDGCAEDGCATKCSCETEEFSAMDSRVQLSDYLVRDTDAGYVKQTDYSAAVYLIFKVNASAAGKAVLSFNVSGNETASWTFVDYFRVWVNPTTEGATYPYDESEKLSKDVYTANTVQGSWEVFGNIVLGEIELKAGENVIALGFTSVGNDAFRFNVKGMSLRSGVELAFAD